MKKPQFIDVCAAWDFAEWGCHMQHASLEKVRETYRIHAGDARLALTWVASQEGKAVGMVTLAGGDHPDFKHFSPWLTALYVPPQYRLKGLANILCQLVVTEADKRNYSHVYLYTAAAEALYRRNEWSPIETVIGPTGLSETLMVRSCH